MGTSTSPSQSDFENLFGPAGREVKQDESRHKRHQRWHLPDVLKGTNSFLTDRVDGLISDATESPFTSTILPYQYVENPDQHLSWDVWSYDEGLASRVPYESAARVLTQTKNTHSAYIVRQGLAISMEHNFMMSERGRRDFNNQLLQLVGSIQYTNDLDVHMALITAPNYERTEVAKYAYSDSDPYVQLRKYVDMFGMCQKNPNGLDILVEDAKQVFKKWGASDPTFMLCNSKLGYQQNMTIEKTQYVTNGVDGIKRLKAGPELKSYRDLSVINSRHFSMEAGRQPRDLLNRRVRVAEHYKLPPMTISEMAGYDVMLYDESRDQMTALPCHTLFDHSALEDGKGDAPDQSFAALQSMDRDYSMVPTEFWSSVYYNERNTSTKLVETEFDTFLKNNLQALVWGEHDTPYHPKFILAFHYYRSKHAVITKHGEDLFNDIIAEFSKVTHLEEQQKTWREDGFWNIDRDKYLSHMTDIFQLSAHGRTTMAVWLNFLQQERGLPTDCTIKNDHISAHLWFTPDYDNMEMFEGEDSLFNAVALFYKLKCNRTGGTSVHLKDTAGGAKGFQHGLNLKDFKKAAAYAFVLPHTANVYSKCNSWTAMLRGGFSSAARKRYSLIIVRPAIEHYMLGVVIGRGGTGELGATLWGQTELSCYDDAMHGKWGMNYKYHARAVVYNEKHLLRLWDVAFNGYTGGMGTRIVKWDTNAPDTGTDTWTEQTLALDEPIKSNFPDMFVMRFQEEAAYDEDVSNPMNFNWNPHGSAAPNPVSTDPENIHTTFSKDMNVFSKLTGPNKKRYERYHAMMPPYIDMHSSRKDAGYASHEGDTHTNSLSYCGTMKLKQRATGNVVMEHIGTGHLGDSFTGSASIRAGHGMMAAGGRPAMQRLV